MKKGRRIRKKKNSLAGGKEKEKHKSPFDDGWGNGSFKMGEHKTRRIKKRNVP